jgi:acyl-CoA reductase-like NAD-dependent aldehyde dehydrogenase
MSSEITSRGTILSRNPANQQVLGEVAITSVDDVSRAVELARKSQQTWSELSLDERLSRIAMFSRILMVHRRKIAELITKETGKPLIESFGGELMGPLDTCKWLLDNAAGVLAPEEVRLNRLLFRGKRSYNLPQPIGVVGIISPWNYAFSIPVTAALMALAAGNTVVIKPSPKAPLVGEAMANLFRISGFPKGVVTVVQGDRDQASALVAARVDRIVFTGSVAGGRAIMSLAAQQLIPVTLELGGKHPGIVLADADVEKAAQAIAWCAFTNAGQACASIERLYVHTDVHDALAARIAEIAGSLRVGEGLDPNTDVGPLIDKGQVDNVTRLVQDAITRGATVLSGARGLDGIGGHFYLPTVLTGVTQDMPIAREEIFGPVLPIIRVDSFVDAINLANESNLALGASIWTADEGLGEYLARLVNAGMVWVNDGLYSHSCASAPWGGTRYSGFGKTHSEHALREFVHFKHIGVDKQGVRDWQYPYSQARLELVEQSLVVSYARIFAERIAALPRLIAAFFRVRR